jgi:hypothetical protein
MRKGHVLAKKPLTLDRFCDARHMLVSFSDGPSASSTRRSLPGAGSGGWC